MSTPEVAREETLREFAAHVGRGAEVLVEGPDPPFVVGAREGSLLHEAGGARTLMDCAATSFPLGHGSAVAAGALRNALEELDCGDHLLMSERRAALARELAHYLPGDIRYTIFCASGGEAIDLAVKIARGVTRRSKIVSFDGSAHGHTGFALAASGGTTADGLGPLAPGFDRIPFGDAGALARAVDPGTAAVLVSPVCVPGGVGVPAEEFLPRVRSLCDAHGALWIADEILTAPSRTGTLWAVDRYRLVPDILVTGGGLGGGIYPIAAACIREKHESLFRRDPFLHVSTGGGTDLGCAVASAVLGEVSKPEFLRRVEWSAEKLGQGARGIAAKHGERLVRSVRSRGLLAGVEMAAPEMGRALSIEMARNNVLARTARNAPGVLVLAPPLTIADGEIDEVLSALDRSLAALAA